MRKTLTAATAVILLALTGCAAAPDEPAPTVATETSLADAVDATPEAAPATVPSPEQTDGDAEAYFLSTGLVSQLDLSDEEKLAAARHACEQVEDGNLDVIALDGVTEQHNRFFVASAITVFCPELTEVYTTG